MAIEFRDETVRVTIELYKELQQLWLSDVANAHSKSDRLALDHTAKEAYQAAFTLKLQKAVTWINFNPTDYERGYLTGLWGLDNTGEKFDGNVVCRRIGTFGATALTNVPRTVIQGSPDGHEWGYGGSGPHDLALDILNWFRPPQNKSDHVECNEGHCSKIAWRLKHLFCVEFIATMPKVGGEIAAETIEKWIIAAESLENWAGDNFEYRSEENNESF